MRDLKVWARSFGTGLSSLRDRARSGLAAARVNPSRMAGFVALALLAGAYGALLIAFTVVFMVNEQLTPLAGLVAFAIQVSLFWALVTLCLIASAVRPY